MATKSFKASYVELRHKTYFAILYVPKDVRHIIGKLKFYKSTQTGILGEAEAIDEIIIIDNNILEKMTSDPISYIFGILKFVKKRISSG